jgi:hypothetical protein
MPSIDDQITEIYVFVDDFLKQHPALAQWRESNNNQPAFSDAEALTIGLSQGCFGVQSLKEAYEKIRNNYREAFPHLPTYQRRIIRLHELDPLIGELLIASTTLFLGEPSFHLI